jgi:sterol 24-C-methyltransferase
MSSRPTLGTLLKPLEADTVKSGSGVGRTVNSVTDDYLTYFDQNQNREEVEARRKQDALVVNNAYYDIATDFYEYGWCESFHFAPLRPGESREHSFAKHEYQLALKMQLKSQQTVLDVGSGVGGPARHMALFADCNVVGINCNDYQLLRSRMLSSKAGLSSQCSFVKGDFNKMPFEDNTFDGAYAIEATCHSEDLTKVFSEVCRVLKPGGIFAVYDWVMTDKFDPDNAYHRFLKDNILEGSGVADVVSIPSFHAAIHSAGLEMLEFRDRARDSVIPWYTVLQPQWTLSDLKITPFGRWLTHIMLAMLETLRLAPSGSVKVHRTLCKGADGLAAAGVEGIFTPMYMVIARKPTKPAKEEEGGEVVED